VGHKQKRGKGRLRGKGLTENRREGRGVFDREIRLFFGQKQATSKAEDSEASVTMGNLGTVGKAGEKIQDILLEGLQSSEIPTWQAMGGGGDTREEDLWAAQ